MENRSEAENGFIDIAVRHLLRPSRWYQWARVQNMSMGEFRDRVAPDIKAFLYGAGFQIDDRQAALIGEALWKKLRREAD